MVCLTGNLCRRFLVVVGWAFVGTLKRRWDELTTTEWLAAAVRDCTPMMVDAWCSAPQHSDRSRYKAVAACKTRKALREFKPSCSNFRVLFSAVYGNLKNPLNNSYSDSDTETWISGTFLLTLLKKGGYVFTTLCLFVCLSLRLITQVMNGF